LFAPQEVSSASGSESDGDDERERELERALADVPFGELQRARADGSLGRAASVATAEKKARKASKKRSGLTRIGSAVCCC
jgi:ribosomal RNA-processing protein 36